MKRIYKDFKREEIGFYEVRKRISYRMLFYAVVEQRMNDKNMKENEFNGNTETDVVVVGGGAVRLCHRRRVTGYMVIAGRAYCTIAVWMLINPQKPIWWLNFKRVIADRTCLGIASFLFVFQLTFCSACPLSICVNFYLLARQYKKKIRKFPFF